MKIILLRHCETEENKKNILQGAKSCSLDDDGVKIAKNIRDELNELGSFIAITSPAIRAVQTADIVSRNRYLLDERLLPFGLGSAEGKCKANVDMRGSIPNPDVYVDMESPDLFVARVNEFFEELKECDDIAKEELTFLVCGHKTTLGAICALVEGKSLFGTDFAALSPKVGKYKIVEYSREKEERE